MKYGRKELQEKIDKIHGAGKITCDLETYTGLRKKARFIDINFGTWYTMPCLVLKGHGHPKNSQIAATKSRKLPVTSIVRRIKEVHNGLYTLDTNTYIGTKYPAKFFDAGQRKYELNVSDKSSEMLRKD